MCSGKGLQSPDSYVAKCLLLARFNVHFVAFAGFNIHVAKYSTNKTSFFSIFFFRYAETNVLFCWIDDRIKISL